ncbi:polysaccharide biosynthesis/export family protein [Fulvivirgaceae bacterium BMA10]|uniref:Polysaccharide biosynthesis/export family protein n=1 Tax=Splendidivirga corallicola TaxID=3051826 RepID=A0ABT8KQI4_9BACT|nr:polysaccharide biosynthesis/export family protein [Fulvivirgaceae bacterium BMA10]
MIQRIFFFVFAAFLLSQCVPVRKQTLLQSKTEENKLAENANFSRMIEEVDFEYRLQTGDIVTIRISSLTPDEFNPFLSLDDRQSESTDPLLSGFLVDKEGYIILPHIGRVLVKGLTIREAQQKIEDLVGKTIDTPSVYMRLVSFHFSILGEVNRQGKYPTYEDKTNILEAIGVAGGLTEFADGASIKIVRTENGITGITKVNVLEEDIIGSYYYYLKPNDIIMVPALKTKNFRQNQANNLALIFSGIATIASVILVFDRINTN